MKRPDCEIPSPIATSKLVVVEHDVRGAACALQVVERIGDTLRVRLVVAQERDEIAERREADTVDSGRRRLIDEAVDRAGVGRHGGAVRAGTLAGGVKVTE